MTEREKPLRLALTGDVMLGRTVAESIAIRGLASPWGDVMPMLRDVDLFLANLECALTRSTERWHDGRFKTFSFRVGPEAVESLRLARVNFTCLANNHTADFGLDGLLETVRVLDTAGIAHAGAGINAGAAAATARIAARGFRLAIVAFADHPEEWAATSDTPGINYLPVSTNGLVMSRVQSALAAARQNADFVIWTIHWGPNMRLRPTPEFREFARAVLSSGADLFWGHSAHVIQGVEFWNSKPILYDTGDFVDDYAVDAELRNDLSALFRVTIRPPQVVALEAIPVVIDDMRVNLARGTLHRRVLRRLTVLCAEMGTRVVAEESGALRLEPTSSGRSPTPSD